MSFGYQILGFGSGGAAAYTGFCEYLCIGGGGSGGSCPSPWWGVGAGGGAGGYRTNYTGTALVLTQGAVEYTATIGAGSPGRAGGIYGTPNGVDSTFAGSGISTVTASGGGVGGGETPGTGSAGGSGGGTPAYGARPAWAGNSGGDGGSPSIPEGYAGGHGTDAISGDNGGGGGGGGAYEVGSNADIPTPALGGAGGDGLSNSITGASVTYAGGGGGSSHGGSSTPISGGAGGGGTGTTGYQTQGTDGLGGGGGGCCRGGTSGAGGDGLVILRIPATEYSGTVTGSPTVTDDGGYKVIKFTGTGTYTTSAV